MSLSPMLVLGLFVVGLILLVVFLRFFPILLWLRALISGVRVSLFQLVFMRFRGVPPGLIVDKMITSAKANFPITANQLESHFLAGGNVTDVTNAVIAAHKANIELPFDRGAAIDLAGRKVFEAVQMSVKPKVIETPKIAGVAKDGIQVLVLARVTVRTNITKLVGGAGEETVIARVGEGVVSTIGAAVSHKDVLEHPDRISKTVLAKGLDQGTAFEILSIDIADVEIGINIGAKLQTDQAEADKRIAQAKAEERRAMAIAREQEMRALAEEMRAKVVEAEKEVPLALADALKNGRLGVMDNYRMDNIQADTRMRRSLAEGDAGPIGGGKA
ncbi:MAG: flotillin-like protein FloA [Spirochaetes bacterium]|nr:flotillin-like protein FloA [Spirochaetota bacterium]